ncbi:MAG: hypothetical protein ACREPX_12720, partial [Rhodanobacteraceae bacterium]
FGTFGSSSFVHFYSRSASSFTLERTLDVSFEANARQPLLAISGQTLLVGFASAPNGNFVDVWVRDQGTWSHQDTLDAGAPYNGLSLAIQGDVALVGSPGDTVLGNATAGTAYVFARSGAAWSRVAHLYDANGIVYNYFGSALALAGNTAFVGSSYADTDAVRTGKATVFTFDAGTWNQGADFADGNAHAGAYFGASVSASGSTIATGAPHARNGYGGAAFVYEHSGSAWLEQATLLPSVAISRGFGTSIALDDATTVVGAHFEVEPGDGGAAYVFTRSGDAWSQSARLTASSSAYFGWSVALAGGWLAVGDPGTTVDISDAPPGNVHLFAGSGSTWNEQTTLVPSVSSNDDQFGYSIAMSGDTLLVGAPLADDGIEANVGLVFEFVNTGSGWMERSRIQAPLVASGAYFDLSVAIQGDTAVVGTGGGQYQFMPRGAAYVYARNGSTWSWQATLAPPIQPIPESYGYAVAISADESKIVVGMPYAYQRFPGQGDAFVFARDGDTWTSSLTLQAPQSTDPYPYNQTDEFGLSVTFAGDNVVVGAPLDGTGGAVYVANIGDAIFVGSFEDVP